MDRSQTVVFGHNNIFKKIQVLKGFVEKLILKHPHILFDDVP